MIVDETQGTPELDEAFATLTPTATQPQGEPTMHIDLIEPTASEPEDTLSAMLVTALMAMLTPRIEAMVEKKFAELATNADTLAQMSDNFRTEITSLIDEAVSGAMQDHVSEYGHPDTDAIDDRVNDALRHADNIVTEDMLDRMVSDVLDEELEGRVSSILDNATVSISV